MAETGYATAKIAVWWDMKDFPVPKGFDPGCVRMSLETAFKSKGYHGSVSITAYDDFKQTPSDLLRGLTSTGVTVVHTAPASKSFWMHYDLVQWRASNPPPAIMMLISDQVEDVFSWDLARLQQRTNYTLFVCCSSESVFVSRLFVSETWLWDTLIRSADVSHETKGLASFSCKSCFFDCQNVQHFKKHLSSRKHAVGEVIHPGYEQVEPVTTSWGRNYQASPEYATSQISVWWDMTDCPIPDGYDPTRVRYNIEAAFKSLGYSGPVSITAYGDFNQTPDHILHALSSTGVAVAHVLEDRAASCMFSDMLAWRHRNPPPASMMLISDSMELLEAPLSRIQQRTKYNMFLAYSFRPCNCKMPLLVTAAEWLLDSLLGVSETKRQILPRCTESVEGTEKFSCRMCFTKSKDVGSFRNHLSSDEHKSEELRTQAQSLERRRDKDALELEKIPKRKRLRSFRIRGSRSKKKPKKDL